MSTYNCSSNPSTTVTNTNHAHEYYKELDDYTLDFRKRKAPTPLPTISFVKKPSPPPPPVVDPIKELNKQLNRQFRPDLVSPTPPAPSKLPSIKRIPSPDPVIFDARAKPLQSPKKKKESSFSFKQKLLNNIHQSTGPTTESTSSRLNMPHQRRTSDDYQVPAGMMLVPIPQQQQQVSTISQQKAPTVVYSNSFKNNKVAPPPSVHNTKHNMPINSFISPSSMISTNPLVQSSYASQQQQVSRHIDQSKTNTKKSKKHSALDPNDTNHSYALYNQRNGRVEGVVKNRLNVAADETDDSRILDDDVEPRGKWALWLSQPLCLGLTRLSGIILFGSMILLSAASIAGLIASIVLYSKDSTTDAQWKILGMVVCAIMLITIIVTLLIFIYCYKNGYMFNQDDDDIDGIDPSTTLDAEGNEKQKAVLRKIYKFNRPNDTTSIRSNVLQDVSSSSSISQIPIKVNDKQTNTETTIAPLRPKDIDRGVWASVHSYGGIAYRPLIPPPMVSRLIQVFPHEIEETYEVPQVIYQVIPQAATVVPSTQIQPRIIQIPAPQAHVVEVLESPKKQSRIVQASMQQVPVAEIIEGPKKQSRIVQAQSQQVPMVEVIEAPKKRQRIAPQSAESLPVVEVIETSKKHPRTTVIRQPQTQQIIVQQTPRIEYVDAEDQRPRRIIQQPEYEIVEEQRPRHVIQQPEYEYVEEITQDSSSILSSSMEEVVEVIDAPRHMRQHGRKKGKKRATGMVSVKHIKNNDDEPRIVVENHKRKHYYA